MLNLCNTVSLLDSFKTLAKYKSIYAYSYLFLLGQERIWNFMFFKVILPDTISKISTITQRTQENYI